MSIQVDSFGEFQGRLKRLARKFRSLPDEVDALLTSLTEQPRQGSSLGGGLYKIRLGSASKGGGKSGDFRVVTYYIERTAAGEVVYLVTIYDKSEEDTILKADCWPCSAGNCRSERLLADNHPLQCFGSKYPATSAAASANTANSTGATNRTS